ncbi:Major Facilitator Superfamily protein [Halolactibacillus halophilus]|uniref:MFS transporter n=1 Tax=Halolactibacillus halophilus TaxID=306540 RepID=A0A1I5QK00_9BACI|nr:MFS transporter [Halolactibacillus halophilus]GEM01828.1 MFS transporter [Halolactibacillus halophilus]SFP46417.1 Major Facilitator Superfamily protein [Halolactibacillus halophilus]
MLNDKMTKRLLFGRLVSSSGDSLYEIAIIWYMFDLTGSAFYTGLASALVMIPKSLNFLVGPIIEMLNKRKVLIFSQLMQFVLMLIVPIAMIFKVESISLILIVMFFVSLLENFQGTAEISIAPLIVDKNQLGQFNSIASSSQQIINVVMKTIFAGSILLIGIQEIYLFNALTFLIAAILFRKLTFTHVHKTQPKEVFISYKQQLIDGLKFFFRSKIFLISLPFLVANFSFGIAEAILPLYAFEKGGSGYYGFLIVALTVGNLLGLTFAAKIMVYPLGKLLVILPLISFTMWGASIWMTNIIIAAIIFGVGFIPFGMMNILLITYIQTSIEEELLARVSSVLDSILVFAMPLGSLLGGLVPSLLGVYFTMFISCLGLLTIALYFLFEKQVRSLPSLLSD